MNRSELIQRIYQKHKQLSVSDVEAAVKVILQSMSTELSEGKRVEVVLVVSLYIIYHRVKGEILPLVKE